MRRQRSEYNLAKYHPFFHPIFGHDWSSHPIFVVFDCGCSYWKGWTSFWTNGSWQSLRPQLASLMNSGWSSWKLSRGVKTVTRFAGPSNGSPKSDLEFVLRLLWIVSIGPFLFFSKFYQKSIDFFQKIKRHVELVWVPRWCKFLNLVDYLDNVGWCLVSLMEMLDGEFHGECLATTPRRGWEANLTALNPLKSCQLQGSNPSLVGPSCWTGKRGTPRFWWRLAFGNQRDHKFFSRWKCFAWTLIICMTNLDQSNKSLCSMPFQMASWSHFEAGLFSQWSQWTKNFQQKNQSPKSFQTYDFLVGFLHKGSARGWKGERGIRVEGGKKKIDGEMAEVFDCLL